MRDAGRIDVKCDWDKLYCDGCGVLVCVLKNFIECYGGVQGEVLCPGCYGKTEVEERTQGGRIMFHLGQKVLLRGEPCIYGGIDFCTDEKGWMFIHRNKEVTWEHDVKNLLAQDVKPIKDSKGEIEVGKFCKEADLYGFFFGTLDVPKLDEEAWRLIEETLS